MGSDRRRSLKTGEAAIMEPKHLMLKAGGRVMKIHGVAHSCYKGVADWYFLADLLFDDSPDRSTGALNRELPPYAVCYDHDKRRRRQRPMRS
jgi:hypothetical protein